MRREKSECTVAECLRAGWGVHSPLVFFSVVWMNCSNLSETSCIQASNNTTAFLSWAQRFVWNETAPDKRRRSADARRSKSLIDFTGQPQRGTSCRSTFTGWQVGSERPSFGCTSHRTCDEIIKVQRSGGRMQRIFIAFLCLKSAENNCRHDRKSLMLSEEAASLRRDKPRRRSFSVFWGQTVCSCKTQETKFCYCLDSVSLLSLSYWFRLWFDKLSRKTHKVNRFMIHNTRVSPQVFILWIPSEIIFTEQHTTTDDDDDDDEEQSRWQGFR